MKRTKQIKHSRSIALVTDPNIQFNYKEAYKSLRTNIKFISKTEKVNTFIITSALQEESKSNVSVNLALTIVEEGKKVILLDCDFRKPTIHKYLKINKFNRGIVNVLMEDCTINEAIYHKKDINLDILTVGIIPPNPSELLSSIKMQNLVLELKKTYDYIIIDTPPISIVTDAAIIGGFSDGAFLVVRSDYAPIEIVKMAKKKLEDVDVKIYGTILTRYNPKSSGNSKRYYEYDKYYSYGEK